MTQDSLVVKAHRPWRYRIFIGILLVAAVASVAYAYVRGLNDGGYYHVQSQGELEEMETTLDQARQEKNALQDRVAILERAQEVDQAARESLRQEVMVLQDEIHNLQEELAFYRGIVSPEDGQSGLRIRDFTLHSRGEPSVYRYSLTLVQALRHDRRVEGQVEIAIHGREGGEARVLDLGQVADSPDTDFSFRYFQVLEGRLELPPAFEAEVVVITASSEGGGDKLEERFEWPEPEG